ncbi:MAG: 6,7-dimethyl-8-ribityllumazine synthase [Chloracidobacterium sp.]|nr:6,7-dimethyl-8-ribityllumazine synthase [Chloracidobacterium sp.]MDW8216700.1 6,7-dimethyl-8-ribityllumazine synthase [Acidobacteriota bacterium]
MAETVREVQGKLIAEGLRTAFVVSRWNDFVVNRLLAGALDAFERLGGRLSQCAVVRVPGSFEIPLTVKKLAMTGDWDAVVCLGALIRGETPHFDYIAAEVTKGVAAVSLETGVPVTFGVITADSLEQAIDRAGMKAGNKGVEAVMAAIELVNLYRSLDARQTTST